MAKVDVLIPTWNRGGLLGVAVQSILTQTEQDFRIVIYDDGSTDGSVEALPKDPRIVLFRGEKNKGIPYARNQLLSHIESPLCCWQDSDDIAHPERLKKILQHMVETGADVGLSYLYFFNGALNRKRWYIYKADTSKYAVPDADGNPADYGIYNNLTFASCFFKGNLQGYPFDLTKRVSEDYEWFRTLIRAGKTFTTLHEPLYFARRHPARTSTLFRGGLT